MLHYKHIKLTELITAIILDLQYLHIGMQMKLKVFETFYYIRNSPLSVLPLYQGYQINVTFICFDRYSSEYSLASIQLNKMDCLKHSKARSSKWKEQ